MSHEDRPMGGDATELEAVLLHSARDDVPGEDAKRNTLQVLGLTAAAGIASSAAVGAAATQTAGAASKATAAMTAAKWLAIGFVAGGVTTSGAHWLGSTDPETPPQPPAVEQVESPSVPVASAPSPVAPPPALEVDEPQAADGPTVPAPSSAAPTLAEQVQSLGEARSELASGNATRALQLLDAHERRFPAGSLGLEVQVVRIEALLASGQPGAAASAARAFLSAHPLTPHTEHVERLLERAEN